MRDDAGINKWDTQTAFALAVRLVDDLPRINMLRERMGHSNAVRLICSYVDDFTKHPS